MEAAAVLEITPETLRASAQACRDRADALRDEQKRLLAEAYRLDREAEALDAARKLRVVEAPSPSARASLAGEIAAYLARCRKPKSSTEIADHFAVSTGRARQALELLTEIGMVYRSGLKRGTRYRILRDGEDPPAELVPYGERWHERVRDCAIELGTFTFAEIAERLSEVSDATVHKWLARLVADGVFTRERVGRTYVYAYEPPTARDRREAAPRASERNGRNRAVAGTGKTKYSRREVAEVVRIAKAAGAEIKPQKHGYAVVVEGETVASVPRTPSDHRSLKNARKALGRGGIRA